MGYALAGIFGYLLGSVSFAALIAKRYGINIFKEGSGNPGATNVKRVLGKKAGNLCFALDFLKGAASVGAPLLLYPLLSVVESSPTYAAFVGFLGALLGHSYSIFLGFRGGKGVAVTIGGFLVLMPPVLLTGVLIWVAVYYASGYVSLASLLLGISLPLGGWAFGYSIPYIVFGAVAMLFILVRHRSNIRRLLSGKEAGFR